MGYLKTSTLLLVLLLISLAGAQSNDSLYGEELVEEKQPELDVDVPTIVSIISPEDLGLEEIREDNIIIRKIGAKATFIDVTDLDIIKKKLKEMQGKKGFNTLLQIQTEIKNNLVQPLAASRSLELYEITSIYSNIKFKSYVTRKKLEFIADKHYDKVSIYEIIPEAVTNDTNDLKFINATKSVLQKEPIILAWSFLNLSEGDNIIIEYYVRHLLIGDEGTVLLSTGIPDLKNRASIGENDGGFLGTQFNFPVELHRAFTSNRISFANFLLIISIIGVLLFGGGIILMELDGRHAFHGIKNVCRDIESVIRVGKKNKMIMEQYIMECINKGHHLEDIRTCLLRAGWNKTAISRLLDKYKED